MRKKVLIVDDSASVRQLVRAVLCSDFDVVEACDGVEGAEAIQREWDLAAVICDTHMPRMGGIEMLELVKQDPRSASLPIVMLSGAGQNEMVQRAKAAGAKGWIVKPFKPELLLAAIRNLTST